MSQTLYNTIGKACISHIVEAWSSI